MPLVGSQRYFTSTAVLLNEVLKLCLSLTISLYEISASLSPATPATTMFRSLGSSVFSGDSWKLAVPALLYTVQNSLQYIAVSNLDAATFQVTYQLKILTTALFSVTMLGRSLSLRKWLALVLLMAGVAIVQIPTTAHPAADAKPKGVHSHHLMSRGTESLQKLASLAVTQLTRRSATYEGIEEDVAKQHHQLNSSIGLTAVIVACLLSGLAGVYFEKVLKDTGSGASVWIRNVQLSFYSLFPALFIGVIFKDGSQIATHGFFAGYNWVVWTAVVFQAWGGLVVALVVNYADNIAKNFATSISIIISALVSVYFFDFKLSASVSDIFSPYKHFGFEFCSYLPAVFAGHNCSFVCHLSLQQPRSAVTRAFTTGGI
jgi:UDP-galactose transporter